MFVQFFAMCYYAYFNAPLGQMKMTLSVANGNEKYDTKAVLKADKTHGVDGV